MTKLDSNKFSGLPQHSGIPIVFCGVLPFFLKKKQHKWTQVSVRDSIDADTYARKLRNVVDVLKGPSSSLDSESWMILYIFQHRSTSIIN